MEKLSSLVEREREGGREGEEGKQTNKERDTARERKKEGRIDSHCMQAHVTITLEMSTVLPKGPSGSEPVLGLSTPVSKEVK